jgi:hypothetical protein
MRTALVGTQHACSSLHMNDGADRVLTAGVGIVGTDVTPAAGYTCTSDISYYLMVLSLE